MSDLIRNFFQSSSAGTAQARTQTLTGSAQARTQTQTKPIEVRPEITPAAVIKVFGVGGGGCNTLNRMVQAKVEGVEFFAINTDAQANHNSLVPNKVTIGKDTTRGLGAGANPEYGKKSAEESEAEIREYLEGSDMVFITAGMGGGTGTGASPVIAEIAKSMGILTIAVVTRPFSFEGKKRTDQCMEGIQKLKSYVDSIIEIPNDRVLSIIDRKTSINDAFLVIDDILRQAVQGISDLINVHGLINVDFADVRTIMQNSGRALMGIGYGTGENRAVEAARAAVESPLLETTIQGAKGIIFNITGGHDLSMFEIDEAARIVTEAADPEATIIFGSVINENYNGEIKCLVIATGFEEAMKAREYGQDMFRKATNTGGISRSSTNSAYAVNATSNSSAARPNNGNTPAKAEDDLEVPAFMRKKLPSMNSFAEPKVEKFLP